MVAMRLRRILSRWHWRLINLARQGRIRLGKIWLGMARFGEARRAICFPVGIQRESKIALHPGAEAPPGKAGCGGAALGLVRCGMVRFGLVRQGWLPLPQRYAGHLHIGVEASLGMAGLGMTRCGAARRGVVR